MTPDPTMILIDAEAWHRLVAAARRIVENFEDNDGYFDGSEVDALIEALAPFREET